jgi:DNA-binding NarL/FixJ family response regulator
VSVVTLLPRPTADSYRDALARGALSAAPRAAASTDIVEVVRAAVRHQSLLPASVSRALASGGELTPAGLSQLGEEERCWLRELANGVSVEDLARRLGFSRRTMYRRLSHVYRALGTNRRERALLAALRDGVI